MKFATLAVLGGLAFAGVALAGEPTPQQTGATGASMKIAIDPKTGKRRALTAAESAALDAQAAASAGNGAMARSARAAAAPAVPALPATFEEAMQNKRIVHGIVGFQPTQEMMSSVTVPRNADGTLSYFENGEPMQAAQEAVSE